MTSTLPAPRRYEETNVLIQDAEKALAQLSALEGLLPSSSRTNEPPTAPLVLLNTPAAGSRSGTSTPKVTTINGMFPDQSSVFLTLDLNHMTIEELKRALCAQSSVYSKMNPGHFVVLIQGQAVQEQWYALDCGVSQGQRIQLVHRTTSHPSTDSNITQQVIQSREHHIRPEEHDFLTTCLSTHTMTHHDHSDPTSTFASMVEEYESICQTRIEHISESISNYSSSASSSTRLRLEEELTQFRMERDTWRLIYELLSIQQRQDQEDPEPEMEQHFPTPYHALVGLGATNPMLQTLKVVLQWLESRASEKLLSNMSRESRHMRMNTDDRTDIDIEPSMMHVQDQEDEVELLRLVWGYCRSGQLDKAVDVCIQLGQPWRGASLSGGQAFGVEEERSESTTKLIRWGNPYRSLWKKTCWKLSESPSSSEIERAIYATCAGNVPRLRDSTLCQTWEDQLWILTRATIEREEEELLRQYQCAKCRTSCLVPGHQPSLSELQQHQLHRASAWKIKTLERVFDLVAESSTRSIREAAEHSYRRLQANLICSRIDVMVSNVLYPDICGSGEEELSSSSGDDTKQRPASALHWELLDDRRRTTTTGSSTTLCSRPSPQYLRFAAHLILFLNQVGEDYDVDAGWLILKAYIQHLVDYAQYHLLPYYVAQLPPQGRVCVYAQVLTRVQRRSSSKEPSAAMIAARTQLYYETLEMMNRHVEPQDVQLILNLAVKRNFDTLVSDDPKKNVVNTRGCILGLHWLCLRPQDRTLALAHANAFIRHLMSRETPEETLANWILNQVLPLDTLAVIENAENVSTTNLNQQTKTKVQAIIREHLCWKVYLDAVSEYNRWRVFTSQVSLEKKNDQSLTFQQQQQIFEQLMQLVQSSTRSLRQVLQYEHGWLSPVVSSFSNDTHDEPATSMPQDMLLTLQHRCLFQCLSCFHHVCVHSAKMIQQLAYHRDTTLVIQLLDTSLDIVWLSTTLPTILDVRASRQILDKIQHSMVLILDSTSSCEDAQ